MTDTDYAVLTVFGEAAGEPIEGKIAVACIIRNRLHSGRWGTSYESVCLAPSQFSCWASVGGDANYKRLMKLKAQMDGGFPINDPVFAETRWVVEGVVHGIVRDRVHQATHYFATSMPEIPKWARGQVPVDRIGGQVFFANIR